MALRRSFNQLPGRWETLAQAQVGEMVAWGIGEDSGHEVDVE